ncbi:hypothetical protein [Streptomyces cinnamoneus]|uniref:hypothetical protein n=1 Tax=Streptomyces cinnamoneus TaxID=53446 RepID=UPI000CEDF8EF|nr:hypothetical protein [Streptomyces cinnamoneus]PPT14826.1 hypothetical protein CYQ11_19880 [Streptomyces cinnamoneus]
MDQIKTLAREVLAIHREVEEWREDHDPGSQEWYTLVNLADVAARLIFALPVEMLPEEEVRTPNPREYQVLDELMTALNEAGNR